MSSAMQVRVRLSPSTKRIDVHTQANDFVAMHSLASQFAASGSTAALRGRLVPNRLVRPWPP